MIENTHQKSVLQSVSPATTERFSQQRLLIGGVTILLILLTIIPIANIFYNLATTGANNLSNDYARILPVIDKILSGNYEWRYFFRDSFIVSHFQPIPIFVHLLNAKLTGWNVNIELYFMALLSILRIFLIYQALTCFFKNKIRFGWLPIIAWLVFSISQISSYEFGFVSVQFGLNAFGITLGVWGLAKYRQPGLAVFIMVAGGMIASWTSASGVMIWPAFLIGMVLLGYKKLIYYFTWLSASILINFPYLYFLMLNRKQGVNASIHSYFDPRLVVNILGRPFANGIGKTTSFLQLGEAAGWIGIFFGLVGLLLMIKYRKNLLKACSPAFMLMAGGLLAAWQTSIFRVLIAPWYTNMVISYWIGLVGLAYLLMAYAFSKNEKTINGPIIKRLIPFFYSVSVLVILAIIYLKTNLTYHDKTFFMVSRSPASAACLRYYEWAPTYCERFVFQWPVNRVYLEDFAWPLQHHNLNVFSSHQQWTMQGDMILGKVYSPENLYSLGVEWYDGLPGAPSTFTDYRPLNLKVTPSQSAIWEVQLPNNLQKAVLSSAVGVGSIDQEREISGPLTYEIYLSQEGETKKLVFSEKMDNLNKGWLHFKLDLIPYQGQEIRLHFTIQGADDTLATLYRFPIINLVTRPEKQVTERPAVRPVNTGLSPQFPRLTPKDNVFNLENVEIYGLEPMSGTANTWKVTAAPYISARLAQPVDLEGFGWLAFSISASPDIPARATRVYLYFEDQEEPVSLLIPLLMVGDMNSYSYPLRMVDIPGRLAAWRLNPVLIPSGKGENRIRLEDFRLVHFP